MGLALPCSAAPQDDALEHADKPDSTEGFRIIQARQRDLIHPGEPLDISGVFEGGNRLTKSLGGLDRSEFRPVIIDEEEAYQRQLALLTPAKRYTSSHSVLREAPAPELSDNPMRAQAPEKKKDPNGPAAWLAALAASAAAMFGLYVQDRK